MIIILTIIDVSIWITVALQLARVLIQGTIMDVLSTLRVGVYEDDEGRIWAVDKYGRWLYQVGGYGFYGKQLFQSHGLVTGYGVDTVTKYTEVIPWTTCVKNGVRTTGPYP